MVNITYADIVIIVKLNIDSFYTYCVAYVFSIKCTHMYQHTHVCVQCKHSDVCIR